MIRDNVYIYRPQAAMQRKFLSNVFITLSANLLIKPLWILGIDRTFQNRLGLESYGLYTNLFTFSVVLGLLLDFGINNYNASSLARQPQLLKQQFYPLALLKLILSVAYLTLTLLLGAWYGYGSAELYLLFVLAINQCLAYGSTYLRSTLTGLQLYKTDALISAVDRLTMVVGGGALLLFAIFPISIQTFVYVQTLGYGVAFAASLLAVRPHVLTFKVQFDWQQIKAVFHKSAPYALLALAMMLYTRSDVLLIRKLLPDGDTENGIYAQSTRLLEAVNMLAVLVSGLLLPMFSNMLQRKESLLPLVRLAMVLLLVPAIVGVVFCIQNAQWLMQLLYNQHNPYHSEVFVFCISSVLPLCVMYVFGTLLTAAGNLRLLIQIAGVALMVNVGLNLWLIPMYGAKGAAVSVLLTHSFVAVSNAIFAVKLLPVKVPFTYFAQFAVFAMLCVAVMLGLAKSNFSLWGTTFLFGCSTVVLVWVTRLVDIESVRKLFTRLRNQ
jgi:O-antigen/teichoic acid export membrane protein